MKDESLSFEQYLDSLSPERRGEVERVWRLVREHVPDGYREEITAKFLTFRAEEEMYVALASWKNYISLYLMPLYLYPELKAKLDAAEKKVKCGKSCINFRRADELPLEAIGEIVGATGAGEYVERVKSDRKNS